MERRFDHPVRISDTEREHVIEHLTASVSEGRLDLAEHDRRTELALRAQTRDELEPLTADLPASRHDVKQAQLERERADRSQWLREWRYWLGGAVIMTAIWGVNSASSGQLESFWPLVPLGIWAAVLLAVAIWPRDS